MMSCAKCSEKVDIVDLSRPYVVRTCDSCGRKINLREPGEHGKGFIIEKGDQVVLPADFVKIAANPLKGNGHFSRTGLAWFAQLIFVEELLNKRESIIDEIDKNEADCIKRLRESSLDRQLVSEADEVSEETYNYLSENQSLSEWWTFLFGLYSSITRDAIEKDDAKLAAWAMACAERCRSMAVFKDFLEEVVWMGHSAKRLVDVLHTWLSNKSNNDEEFWQQVFKENPYVLSQIFSVPVVFLQDKAYVGGMQIDRNSAKFVDYLYKNDSSNEALLVEIKTPGERLLSKTQYRNGVHSPTSALTGSVLQVLNYRRELAKSIHSSSLGTEHKIEIFNPRCVIIVGNAEDELDTPARRTSFELFRTSLKDVEVVTFDEIFKKAEILATLFNLTRAKPSDSKH
jgi:hypothetical protein